MEVSDLLLDLGGDFETVLLTGLFLLCEIGLEGGEGFREVIEEEVGFGFLGLCFVLLGVDKLLQFAYDAYTML
jgi:hypothetical protein